METSTATSPETPLAWQSKALAAIALLGLADTSYLLLAHANHQELACPGTGFFQCDAVVNSPYSQILGVPLAAFGFAAYLTVLVLALLPRTVFALRTLTTAMALTGGFLLFLMVGVLHNLCLYCLLSVALSLALFGIAGVPRGGKWLHFKPQVAGTILALLMALAIGTAPGPTAVVQGGQAPLELEFKDLTVTTPSGPSEIALATWLAGKGARMYGGFKCPHCHRAKQLFGKEAFSRITYVECDRRAPDAKPDQCDAAGIRQYPTWIIGPIRFDGERDLDTLAAATGYQGPRAFQRRIGGK